MASTHRGHFFHLIWSTKHRKNLILPKMQGELYAYMGGIIRKCGGSLIEIGGVQNHVHLLVAIAKLETHTTILRNVKAGSTSWLKSSFPEARNFSWQDGYGSFTVNPSIIDPVRKYIANQEKHHAKMTYENEYLAFLDAYKIDYDPKYVFD